jgi:hypothetical protein
LRGCSLLVMRLLAINTSLPGCLLMYPHVYDFSDSILLYTNTHFQLHSKNNYYTASMPFTARYDDDAVVC